MHTEKRHDEKFASIDDFIDVLKRGGEIEFVYANKEYSITHVEGKICLTSIKDETRNMSEIIVNSITELFDVCIFGKKIRDIVTEIQPYFRSL